MDLKNLSSKNLLNIVMSEEDVRLITLTIERDTEFFRTQGIMDYSILLGVEHVKARSKESLFAAKIKQQRVNQGFNLDDDSLSKNDMTITDQGRQSHSINIDLAFDS